MRTPELIVHKIDEDTASDTFGSAQLDSQSPISPVQSLTFFMPATKKQATLNTQADKLSGSEDPIPFTVSADEWDTAIAYFTQYPESIKCDKRESKLLHSFIQIEGKIYAITNRNVEKLKIPRGSNAKIKTIIDRNNNKYALRIEVTNSNISSRSSRIGRKIGFMQGEAFRPYGKPFRSMRSLNTDFKHYSVLKYVEGEDLKSLLARKELSHKQRMQIAILTMNAVLKLHRQRVIHADLKPANLIISMEGDEVVGVEVVDFGFSRELSMHSTYVQGRGCGSPAYMPPELLPLHAPARHFSFASDIYSLGIMLNRDLGLGSLCFNMRNSDPNQRGNLDSYRIQFEKHLEQHLSSLLLLQETGHANQKSKSPTIKIMPTATSPFLLSARFSCTRETPKSPELSMEIDDLLSTDVRAEYRRVKRHNSIITRLGKSLGKSLHDKRRLRHLMVENIVALMSRLKESKLDPAKKIGIVQAFLSWLTSQIRLENNHYESSLYQVCKDLEHTVYRLLQNINPIEYPKETRINSSQEEYFENLRLAFDHINGKVNEQSKPKARIY